MRTATQLTYPRHLSKKVTKAERRAYLARFRALDWSQNEAGRRIGKDQGLFGRWIRGELSSAIIRTSLDTTLAEYETYRAAKSEALAKLDEARHA